MYTTQYFIDKFTAIPDNKWYTGSFVNPSNTDQRCAFGHCHVVNFKENTLKENAEQQNLNKLFSIYLELSVVQVNDNLCLNPYKYSSPKARILAALNDIKAKQQTEISDPPVYVEDMIELCEIPG